MKRPVIDYWWMFGATLGSGAMFTFAKLTEQTPMSWWWLTVPVGASAMFLILGTFKKEWLP